MRWGTRIQALGVTVIYETVSSSFFTSTVHSLATLVISCCGITMPSKEACLDLGLRMLAASLHVGFRSEARQFHA